MIVNASDDQKAQVVEHLSLYPYHLVKLCKTAGTKIHILQEGEGYLGASKYLSNLSIEIDSWPNPPAGLFVVEERTIFIKQLNQLTMTHEFGHALDCALGEGIYLSSSEKFREAYNEAREFVSPYAASGLDEYFAEGCRAMVSGNDGKRFWPEVSPSILEQKDPTLFKLLSEIFSRN